MLEKLQEATDFAITNGLLKYNSQFQLTHAPFCLTPYEVSQKMLDRITALTPVFNELMLKVGQNIEFLADQLGGAAQTDNFIHRMLKLALENQGVQPCQLMISRNDFFLAGKGIPLSELYPKQVEFNTISNSFVFLSRQIYQLHKYLYRDNSVSSALLDHDPLEEVVDAMASVIKHYDCPGACLLMVVQSREQNLFDQRAIEYRLFEKYNIFTLRLTLQEIAERGKLKEGHLVINEQIAALTYFRAGYTPDDFVSPEAWKGRELIEASSSIKTPSVGIQLAGTKKIQQVLTKPEILQQFLSKEIAEDVATTFVGMYSPEENIDGTPAYRMAKQFPEKYVLKPQREGGGNNLYDQEMVRELQTLSEEQRQAYILMERILPQVHSSLLVVENNTEETSCVSEIGRYGVCFFNGKEIQTNRDVGYLVRTKSADQNEGGVCAGYACLNSICVSE